MHICLAPAGIIFSLSLTHSSTTLHRPPAVAIVRSPLAPVPSNCLKMNPEVQFTSSEGARRRREEASQGALSVEYVKGNDYQRSCRGPCMKGVLAQPDQAHPNVLLFASYAEGNDNAVIIVAGLSDGMMSYRWLLSFAQAVDRLGFATVQVNLSSSFGCCGLSSIAQDARELETVVRYLRREMNIQKIILVGHSTGSQDIIAYFRHVNSEKDIRAKVDGAVFLCGVSDRESLSLASSKVPLQQLTEEAEKLVEKGENDRVLSERIMSCYFTASRFLSISRRLGDEDMFSTDLTPDELQRIFAAVDAPSLFIYAEQDEFVPDMERLRELAHTIKKVVQNTSPHVEMCFLPGDHSFSNDAHSATMISAVCKFLERFA